ncbi:hypothetical protein V6N11_059013 [Hibiscus sabdariffa]|uniref:Neogenin C-terminal domain-containing protein n=1 Tax=Hibiscus sabdariffa TaxID=183260 RepID=A0ABR2U6M4_9ROSI
MQNNAASLSVHSSIPEQSSKCLDSMGPLVGTPNSPYIVPPGTITPRKERVYLQRTAPTPASEPNPSSNDRDNMHKIHDQLDSIETNLTEILSYLHPDTSQRDHDRGRH